MIERRTHLIDSRGREREPDRELGAPPLLLALPRRRPVDERVVYERLEKREQRLLRVSQHAQDALARAREGALDAGDAERRLHRVRHAERHVLWHFEPEAPLETDRVVDVQQLACAHRGVTIVHGAGCAACTRHAII